MTLRFPALPVTFRRSVLASALVIMLLLPAAQAQAQQIVFDPTTLGQTVVQWAKEAAQWVLNNKLMSSISSATVGSGMAATEANATLVQTKANQDAARDVARETASRAVNASFTDKQTFCPRMMEIQNSITSHNALGALENALESGGYWAGAGGGNTLSEAQLTQQLCAMSLIGPSQGCPSPAFPQYADGRVYKSVAVTSITNAPFPCSVISTDGKGHMYFKGTPQEKEMPAIAAIWSCILRHNDTATPVSDNATGTEAMYIRNRQIRMQAEASSVGDRCIKEVAKRLAVGSSCTGGQLKQIYQANSQLCTQIQNKMQASDFSACTSGDGVSWMKIREAKACPHGNPAYLVQKVSANPNIDEADKDLDNGVHGCDAFSDKMDDEERDFQNSMQQPTFQGGVEYDPAARSTK